MSDCKPKKHRIRFPTGAPPQLDPAGGAYRAPPDPLAVFKGPVSKGRAGEGGEGKGTERKEEGGSEGRDEGKGPRLVVVRCRFQRGTQQFQLPDGTSRRRRTLVRQGSTSLRATDGELPTAQVPRTTDCHDRRLAKDRSSLYWQ